MGQRARGSSFPFTPRLFQQAARETQTNKPNARPIIQLFSTFHTLSIFWNPIDNKISLDYAIILPGYIQHAHYQKPQNRMLVHTHSTSQPVTFSLTAGI